MKKGTKITFWILASFTIVAGGFGAYLLLAPKDGQTKIKAGKNYTYKKGQGWIDNTVTSAGEYTAPNTAQSKPKPSSTSTNRGTPIVGTPSSIAAPVDAGFPQYGIPATTVASGGTKPAAVGESFYSDSNISASNPLIIYSIVTGTGLVAVKTITAPNTYVGKVLSIDTFDGVSYARTFTTYGTGTSFAPISKVHSNV